MKAVFLKEWRELRLVAAALAVIGVLIGYGLKFEREAAWQLLTTFGVGGAVVGVWQGLLDRVACRDAFVLHRPISSVGLHLARTYAGAAACAAAFAATLLTMFVVPGPRGFFRTEDVVALWPTWRDVTPGLVALAVGFGLATWSAARLGASSRRIVAVLVLAIGAPTLATLSFLRAPSALAAAAFVVLTTLVLSALVVVRASLRSQGEIA